MIGKVADKARLVNVLHNTPIRQGQLGWNCVIWVKEVLEGLKADGKAMGIIFLEWESVRNEAMGYCQRKKKISTGLMDRAYTIQARPQHTI